ncbi:MAG: NAD(P)H-binding protein [Bryobacteraceae bacterium]
MEMEPLSEPLTVVVLGATGAVGTQAIAALLTIPRIGRITVLTRRPAPVLAAPVIQSHVVDTLDPQSYRHLLPGHRAAVCTFGVGQPSKVTDAEFVRVDKTSVLEFATACRQSGVTHFELLGSVGVDPLSRSFYLRTKGELREALVALNFPRLSVFQPSMILTPANRYGVGQGIMLALWPRIHGLLIGGWQKYRGIPVETLGKAMATNLVVAGGHGTELLHWADIVRLADLNTTSTRLA